MRRRCVGTGKHTLHKDLFAAGGISDEEISQFSSRLYSQIHFKGAFVVFFNSLAQQITPIISPSLGEKVNFAPPILQPP